MRRKRALVYALSLLTALLYLGCSDDAPSLGAQAPAFSLQSLDGKKTLTLNDFKSKAVVIDFWATWCQPCREAMPELAQLYQDYKPKGVDVIGVSDEKPSTIIDYLHQYDPGYEIYADPEGAAHKSFNVSTLPTVIVLDPNGKILYQQSPADMDEVRQVLDHAVKNST